MRLQRVTRSGTVNPAASPLETDLGRPERPAKKCTGSVSGNPTFRVPALSLVINLGDNASNPWDTECER